MAQNTVYFLTGAARGIGRAMATILLARPSTTLIVTVRDVAAANAKSLQDLPAGKDSKLIILELDVTASEKTYAELPHQLKHEGISSLDVVIANAGAEKGFQSILKTPLEDLTALFDVNTLGPIKLFRTLEPLLATEKGKEKKFVIISSVMGSIGILEEENFPGLSYGVSKAAINWFGKKVHMDFPELAVGLIHPGWVQTPMGQSLADTLGIKEPPTDAQASAEAVVNQIDLLSRSTTSGKLISQRGDVLPF